MKKRSRVLIYLVAVAGIFVMLTSSCKKSKDSSDPTPEVGQPKDIDGNVYTIVTIGSQVWMAENLKTTRYRNGDSIPNVRSATAWNSLTTGAYCNYNNDTTNSRKYGRLYNFYAVSDSRKIAPVGWHVASDGEWNTLKTYVLANLGNSGSYAKAIAAKTDWGSSTQPAAIGNDLTLNNSIGFTALPAGFRWNNGTYAYIGVVGYWWSSTESGAGSAFLRMLNVDSINELKASDLKTLGFSVRCVRDLPG